MGLALSVALSVAQSAGESKVPVWLCKRTDSEGSVLTALAAGAVFDGDNVFLHGADRIAHDLEESMGSKWKGSYFMPAQADRCTPPEGHPLCGCLSHLWGFEAFLLFQIASGSSLACGKGERVRLC